jgi:SAM-dependent methyltransferase
MQKLTDPVALTRNRARARKIGAALFLHKIAADEIKERLFEVNKSFTNPVVVTPFPEIWQDFLPNLAVVSPDERLDLALGAHDLVIHALCLHWSDDPVGQLVQCRRALMPDGLLFCLTFGGQTLHELRSALAEAESRMTGGLSPRVLPMGEIRDMGALLQRAGLALPVADGFTQTVRYRDLLHLARDLRAMGEGNALAGRLRNPTRRSVIEAATGIYAANFADAEGRIPATFDIIALTGWAPHEAQQKPLRPGSAAHRLADALNSPNFTLHDHVSMDSEGPHSAKNTPPATKGKG